MNHVKMTWTSISTNAIYQINNQSVDRSHCTYVDVLEFKLNQIYELIEFSFRRIKGCLFENKAAYSENKRIELISEAKRVQDWYNRQGYAELGNIKEAMRKKDIHQEHFIYLTNVFENQNTLFENLLDSKSYFTEEQIESLLRYLAELPSYLKFDLMLDTLNDKKKIRKTIKLNGGKQEVRTEKEYKYKLVG